MTDTNTEQTVYADTFRKALDMPEWQFERAVRLGLIPPAEDTRWTRWTQAQVDAALADRDRIAAECGDLPDYGAVRAAEILEKRFGLGPGSLDPDVLLELGRAEVVPRVGSYKGHPVYCGHALARFHDRELLDQARHDGQLYQRGGAARLLQIRDSDFDHLLRAKLIHPVCWVRSAYPGRVDVALFRRGDLDQLLHHPAIDWDAVRATPKGRPSPLAKLTAEDTTAESTR